MGGVGAADGGSSGAAAVAADGMAGELAIISARLQRLALRLESNVATLKHYHRRMGPGDPVASEQATLAVTNTPLVASTEVGLVDSSMPVAVYDTLVVK